MATEESLRESLEGIKQDIATQKEALTALNAGIDNVVALVAQLKDEVANGGVVSQETLDSLSAQAESLDAAGDEITAGLEAASEKLKS